MKLKNLTTPAFVINRHAFEGNCRSMLDMVRKRKLKIRPHIKSHKTREGALIQAGDGIDSHVTGFVASTLPEINMLVDAVPRYGGPFRDVLYGVPISESKLEALDSLRRKVIPDDGQIHILIDHPVQVAFVEKYIETSPDRGPFSAFLKLDTGYHRAGITCDDRGVDLAVQILQSPHLDLTGVYSHCGHAYDEHDAAKQQEIAGADIQQISLFLELLKRRLDDASVLDNLTVSIGSTPSARHHYNVQGLSNVEIHPGNYSLFDRQQLWTGACTESDVAGRVISRVTGSYEDRNTIMLDAGATALTKDETPQGGVCAVGSHSELDCYRMSQEVILVRPRDTDTSFPFDEFPLGTMVNLLPNHSCLAAACFEKYYVIDDPSCTFSPEEEVVDEWTPAKFFDIVS